MGKWRKIDKGSTLRYGLLRAILTVAVNVLIAVDRSFLSGLTSTFYGSHYLGWDGTSIMAPIVILTGGLPIEGVGLILGLVTNQRHR